MLPSNHPAAARSRERTESILPVVSVGDQRHRFRGRAATRVSVARLVGNDFGQYRVFAPLASIRAVPSKGQDRS